MKSRDFFKAGLVLILVVLLGLFWLPSSTYATYQSPITIQSTTTNDPLFSRQDNLTQIRIPQAWDITVGEEIVIAVIDTGIYEQHEDLIDKLWVNPGEIPNNCRDDDGNGYVDDLHGYNFYQNNTDLSDQNGHGTSIASVIGSSTNNSKGVAGINWQAKIMVLKALNNLGGGEYHHVAQAIHYAVDNHAQVINMSFGTYADDPELRQAVNYAIANNVPIVAAAGNNNKTQILYPAAYPSVISVGAVDSTGQRASFSNYGDNLDVMAPGVDIPSAGYTSATTYVSNSGTSYAAAHITGVVSLILSKFSSWTSRQIELAVKSAAVNQENITEYGNGIIDAVAVFNPLPQVDKLSATIIISRHSLPADGISKSTIVITVKQNGKEAKDRLIYIDTNHSSLKIDNVLVEEGKFDLGKTDEFGKIELNLSSYTEGQKQISFFDSISNAQLGSMRITFGPIIKVDYQAVVVGQSPDVNLQLGEETELWVELTNIGTSPWIGSGSSNMGQIRLGASSPTDRNSAVQHSSWLSNNRVATFEQSMVEPGETAKITFLIKANQPGNYREYFDLVAEYKTWLPTLGIRWDINVNGEEVNTQPDSYQAQLESHSADIELQTGQMAQLTATFKNTSNNAWPNGSQSNYGAVRLGTYAPNDRTSKFQADDWLSSNRVSGTGSNINPDGRFTLSFNVQAPDVPGVYYESFRLVSEHIAWFGPSVKWRIKVI